MGREGLECRPGDRVAIIAANSTEVVEWFFGCAAGGFIGLAANTRLGVDAVKEMLEAASPRAVIVDEREADLADELRDIGCLPLVEVGYGAGLHCDHDYETVLAAAVNRIHLPAQAPATPFLLTATSGTTGKVKMTIHSHLGDYTALQCTQASARLMPSSRLLTALPMFRATATGRYWVSLFTGVGLHLLSAFDPVRLVGEVERSGITHSIVGPSPLYQVMDAQIDLAPLRRMEFLGAGGAPFDTERFYELCEETNGTLATMYSMSERTFSCVLRPEDVWSGSEFNHRIDSVGRPQTGADIRLVGDDGIDVPPDRSTPGEVLFSAPGIATSYWSSPEEQGDLRGWLGSLWRLRHYLRGGVSSNRRSQEGTHCERRYEYCSS
jgi:acyl-CoA synthetase (AMP-forming)/AMP-acid ligase II